MNFNPLQPYNELPLLPPSAEIETKAVLKACIEARAALAELRQAGNRIPNQAVLINAIPMLEAQASSEIENIVTTGDAMFRYAEMENQAQDPATKEALRYRSALHEGFRSLSERPLCTNTAIRVCSRIKNSEMDIRRITGTALENRVTGEIIYTPPVGENLLREKLANWERFIHESTQIDPLIRMAVAHYQFEAIHPFVDGNGRTGRILNLLVLVEQGLLDIPVLYLSRHILRTRDRYYDGLLFVTRSEQWEPWILYMLEAIYETAKWTTAKIEAIAILQHAAKRFVKQHAPKLYSHELINTLFAQPYCRIQNLVDTGIVKRQTASSYLQQLNEIGMLREIQIGRDKLFMHPQFLRLLTSDTHEVPEYRAINPERF